MDDLHSFDLINMTWTQVVDPNLNSWCDDGKLCYDPPRARSEHGFTSAGGKLYVYGGYSFGKQGIGYTEKIYETR